MPVATKWDPRSTTKRTSTQASSNGGDSQQHQQQPPSLSAPSVSSNNNNNNNNNNINPFNPVTVDGRMQQLNRPNSSQLPQPNNNYNNSNARNNTNTNNHTSFNNNHIGGSNNTNNINNNNINSTPESNGSLTALRSALAVELTLKLKHLQEFEAEKRNLIVELEDSTVTDHILVQKENLFVMSKFERNLRESQAPGNETEARFYQQLSAKETELQQAREQLEWIREQHDALQMQQRKILQRQQQQQQQQQQQLNQSVQQQPQPQQTRIEQIVVPLNIVEDNNFASTINMTASPIEAATAFGMRSSAIFSFSSSSSFSNNNNNNNNSEPSVAQKIFETGRWNSQHPEYNKHFEEGSLLSFSYNTNPQSRRNAQQQQDEASSKNGNNNNNNKNNATEANNNKKGNNNNNTNNQTLSVKVLPSASPKLQVLKNKFLDSCCTVFTSLSETHPFQNDTISPSSNDNIAPNKTKSETIRHHLRRLKHLLATDRTVAADFIGTRLSHLIARNAHTQYLGIRRSRNEGGGEHDDEARFSLTTLINGGGESSSSSSISSILLNMFSSPQAHQQASNNSLTNNNYNNTVSSPVHKLHVFLVSLSNHLQYSPLPKSLIHAILIETYERTKLIINNTSCVNIMRTTDGTPPTTPGTFHSIIMDSAVRSRRFDIDAIDNTSSSMMPLVNSAVEYLALLIDGLVDLVGELQSIYPIVARLLLEQKEATRKRRQMEKEKEKNNNNHHQQSNPTSQNRNQKKGGADDNNAAAAAAESQAKSIASTIMPVNASSSNKLHFVPDNLIHLDDFAQQNLQWTRLSIARTIHWLLSVCPTSPAVCSLAMQCWTRQDFAILRLAELGAPFADAFRLLELTPHLCGGKQVWPILTALFSAISAVHVRFASLPEACSRIFEKVFPHISVCLNHCRRRFVAEMMHNQLRSRQKHNNNSDAANDDCNEDEDAKEECRELWLEHNMTLVLYHITIVHCCSKQSGEMTTLAYQVFSDYQTIVENSRSSIFVEGNNSNENNNTGSVESQVVSTLKSRVAEVLGTSSEMVNWPGLNRMV